MAATKKSIASAGSSTGFEHRSEIVRILRLAIAQIENAMQQSDQSVNALGDAFATILDCEDEISRQLMHFDAADPFSGGAPESAARLGSQTRSAIIALQFYDRLSQRLQHVAGSLELLGDLLARAEDYDADPGWEALRSQIRSRYSMNEERELYDRILGDESGRTSECGTRDKTGDDFENF